MPMDTSKYEELLGELNNPDLTHTRKTEILQELRGDYSTVHADFKNISTENESLKKHNDDLLMSNSMLFRKAGIQKEEEKIEEKKQEFSETVRLEHFEKNLRR